MWFFNDGASAGRLSKKANSAVISLEEAIKKLTKNGGDKDLIITLGQHAADLKTGQTELKSSLTKGGQHFTNAKDALKEAMENAKGSIKEGNKFLNDIKAFNKASKPMGPFKKTGLWILGIAAVVTGVSWLLGKRQEAKAESREALLDQQLQALSAMQPANNNPLLGANTLGGLERVEGANVAKYAGKGNSQGIDFSQPALI